MTQVRSSCFETNSSSAHSLVVTKGKAQHYTPEEAYKELYWMDNDGYWDPHGSFYFGRHPFQVLSTFKAKLRYAYACAPTRKGRQKKSGYAGYWKEYYRVTNAVKKFFGQDKQFNGLDPYIKRRKDIGTDDCLLFSWLKKLDITLIEFLTNKNIIVICDGDEYCIWTDMKKLGLINTENIQHVLPEKQWWEEDDDGDDINVTEEVLEEYKKEGED